MNRSKLSQALFGGALTLVASSIVHAGPNVFESRDDATFSMRVSKAVPGLAIGRPDFALSGASTTHGGKPRFGTSHETSPFGGTISLNNSTSLLGPNARSFDSGKLPVSGWHSNPRASLNHGTHDHEQAGANVAEKTSNDVFAAVPDYRVSPVSAIPEPSTYALLALGLAGIAMVRRRRRGGDR